MHFIFDAILTLKSRKDSRIKYVKIIPTNCEKFKCVSLNSFIFKGNLIKMIDKRKQKQISVTKLACMLIWNNIPIIIF